MSTLEKLYFENSSFDAESSHKLWLSYPPRKRAAVLAIIFPIPLDAIDKTYVYEYGLVLTQRSENLKVSPSVSALPGGKFEESDLDDEWKTALREAKEEIGFDPEAFPKGCVARLGMSPCYLSVGNDVVRLCAVILDPYHMDSKFLLEKTTVKEKTLHILREVAPSVSFAEVALTYVLPLKTILSKNGWYIKGTEMRVMDTPWIFHDYKIPMNETVALSKAVPDDLPEHQFRDSNKSDSDSPANRDDGEVTKDDETIILHGLTSHMVIDLARTFFSPVTPSFPVLSYLGSDEIVQKYYNYKYSSSI